MNTNGQLTAQQEQQWNQVVLNLQQKGVNPTDVQEFLLKKYPEVEEGGGGLWEAGGRIMNSPIRLKHVVYAVVGIIGFAVLLKLVGKAFDVSIPLIHDASGSADSGLLGDGIE